MDEKTTENDIDGNLCTATPSPSDHSQELSKRQQKKLMRQQKWLATKDERKQREKEKAKLKRKALIEAGVELGPSRKFLKTCKMKLSSCKQRLSIDMSFDEYMSERDLCKALKQVHRCYSNNRRAANPMQFYVTSFTGKCLKVMEKNNGFRNWDVNFQEETYLEAFPRNEIVYLSSESENVIEVLDEKKAYIIGGIVDHNCHKGLCHRLAVENKVAHARLPIDQYLEMKTRKVLTIDHVFQIMLAVTQGQSWKEAFLSIIPARKGATDLKDISSEHEHSDTDDEANIDDETMTDGDTGSCGNKDDQLKNDCNFSIGENEINTLTVGSINKSQNDYANTPTDSKDIDINK